MAKRRIDFVYFDAGGGHRSAANALKLVIERERPDWEIRMMNLQEVLDRIDVFRKVTGLRLEDVYNTLLKKGWTLGSAQMVPMMHLVIRAFHSQQVKILTGYWREERPDMVVSLVPNFTRAQFESLHRALPGVPFVTILTDVADYPPHFWMEPQDQYVVCGSERAVAQARQMGLREAKIFRASGMILHPRFYEPVSVDRAAERVKLGLRPELPTGMLMFGGEGSSAMTGIVETLGRSGLKLQLIVICGRNEKLRARLKALKTDIPVFVEGFTREVPYYMHLSDFFIGKPGPGSISEALAMKLPVIVERNAWTLPQERYNADWIRQLGVGLVGPNFRGIDKLVGELLAPANFERFRAAAAVAGERNRAVFEIPNFLAHVLETHS